MRSDRYRGVLCSTSTGIPDYDCSGDVFHCGDGDCIPSDWACDGERDCELGEDELNCSKYIYLLVTYKGPFKCYVTLFSGKF